MWSVKVNNQKSKPNSPFQAPIKSYVDRLYVPHCCANWMDNVTDVSMFVVLPFKARLPVKFW